MPTTAYPSAGSKMEVLIDSPSTWAEIVQSDGWDGPGNQLTLEDITNLSSAAGSIEKVPVTQEIPPLTATLIYNPANAAHAYLRASNAAPFPKTLESFRFTSSAPTPIVSTFSGYVSKFHPAHKAKTSAKVNLEITPTGPLTTT